MGKILTVDVHCHLNPQRYLQEVVRLAERQGNPRDLHWFEQVSKKMLNNSKMWDPAERVADLEPAGIDVQVVSVSTPNVYFTKDDREVLALAQMVNDDIADVCRAFPGKYLGLAALPLINLDDAVDEMDRAIDKLGLSGLAIGDNIDGEPLTSPRFEPFWAEVNRRRLAVALHPMVPPAVEEMTEYDLTSTVGFMFDTTLAAMRMVFSGLLERNPNIRFILPHLGGTIPFLMSRIKYSYQTRPECQEAIARPPQEYLKQCFYDTSSDWVPALRCTYETFRAERMVFGCDYPLGFRMIYMRSVIPAIENLGLSRAEEEMIFHKNALSILKNVPPQLHT